MHLVSDCMSTWCIHVSSSTPRVYIRLCTATCKYKVGGGGGEGGGGIILFCAGVVHSISEFVMIIMTLVSYIYCKRTMNSLWAIEPHTKCLLIILIKFTLMPV